MTSLSSRRKTHRLPTSLSLFPDFETLRLSVLLPAPGGEPPPPPGPLYWPCRPWGRHHGPSLFPEFDLLTFSTGETKVPLRVSPVAVPAPSAALVVPLHPPVPVQPDPAPLRTFSTGETKGQAVAPEPVLSEAAQRLLDHLRDEGSLSVVTARHLLGRDPMAALSELQAAWRISEIPGGASSRQGRAASYRFVPQCAAHETLPLAYAYHVLAGKHGTLSAFITWLDVSEAEVLTVMRGLIAAGLAQGGPVGATFAFRVSAGEHGVTPSTPTVKVMSTRAEPRTGPDRGTPFMPTTVGGGN